MKECKNMDDYLSDIKLPKFYKARQRFDTACIERENIPAVLRKELEGLNLEEKTWAGMRIAITAGSRGVANIDVVLQTIVAYLQELKTNPFIVPAMGSHGGGTAEGQREILKGYKITEETMGCPIISAMEVVKIGVTEDGRDSYIDKNAAEADGIVVVGRIKPHTAFRGPYQSGLMKMMAIGLGKQYGARVCHAEGFRRMGYNVEIFGKAVIKNSNVLCAVGLIENAFDKTWKIAAMHKEDIEKREPGLLKEAESRMPQILFSHCDVLIVNEIGKNFSGDGMDPNVTGTFATPYATGNFSAERVCVLDLSPESHGNGMGSGMASVITKKVFDQLDLTSIYLNGFTCRNLNGSRIPCVLPTDENAIKFCLGTCVEANPEEPKIIRIFNSQFVEYIWISEALAKKLPEGMELIGEPEELKFDETGNLTDKEPRQRGQRYFKED